MRAEMLPLEGYQLLLLGRGIAVMGCFVRTGLQEVGWNWVLWLSLQLLLGRLRSETLLLLSRYGSKLLLLLLGSKLLSRRDWIKDLLLILRIKQGLLLLRDKSLLLLRSKLLLLLRSKLLLLLRSKLLQLLRWCLELLLLTNRPHWDRITILINKL
jgi:hypothetical protein